MIDVGGVEREGSRLKKGRKEKGGGERGARQGSYLHKCPHQRVPPNLTPRQCNVGGARRQARAHRNRVQAFFCFSKEAVHSVDGRIPQISRLFFL